jgi:hypothetical protein
VLWLLCCAVAAVLCAVQDLLNKTGIQPRQIGIIITNSR